MRFMIHDNIMVADKICTGGSKMLENFKAPFSATVYERCVKNGMEFVGLLPPKEFGIDNLFDEEDTKDTSITAINDNRCDIVLCNDVFGKLRRQAPSNGLIYIHPAYGTVSRFGLMAAISSMDQIGVLCRTLKDGVDVLSAISGHDKKDGTSLPRKDYSYKVKQKGPIVVGMDPALPIMEDPDVHIKLEYFDVFSEVFYILGTAEISNNTSRYDGVRYGYRADDILDIDDLYLKSRTGGFGPELKLASLVGCMVLSQENYKRLYHKSMQVRRLIRDYYSSLFDRVDVIALPIKLDTGTKYRQSALYALPVLGGFPCISAPYKGTLTQFVCRSGNENAMFALVKEGLE